ncbi:hypothetical protein [Neolewinella agarilytica]|nr:hypothetical protein [Neolewinella agarilytica]
MPELPSLTIRFSRPKSGRTVLSVTRSDGSMTWAKLHPGTELHDLAHYAIETELELKDAFYGILAAGYAIEDFEARPEERPDPLRPANLPRTSLQVEHLVNLLLTELQSGAPLQDFIPRFQEILRQSNLPEMLLLTEEKLCRIREQLNILRGRWNAVAVGGAMELEF